MWLSTNHWLEMVNYTNSQKAQPHWHYHCQTHLRYSMYIFARFPRNGLILKMVLRVDGRLANFTKNAGSAINFHGAK